MKLTQAGQERAGAFIARQARPLEQALYRYHFQDGPAADALAELARFQNADGGFGRGLEPDLRLSGSSVIATTVALQTLRELRAGEDDRLVQGAMGYLLDAYDPALAAWPIVPAGVNEAPHAPWWFHDQDLAQRWGGFLANPRAEIVGYLFDYVGLTPVDLRNRLAAAALAHLEEHGGGLGMHDLLCYVRLAETERLPAALRASLVERLRPLIDSAVAREPTAWAQYGLKPLDVAGSPASPFAAMLAEEIDLNLRYEIEQQQPDGSWAPAWSWGEAFAEAWQQAEREWRGVLTLKALRRLQRFGRLA